MHQGNLHTDARTHEKKRMPQCTPVPFLPDLRQLAKKLCAVSHPSSKEGLCSDIFASKKINYILSDRRTVRTPNNGL